MPPCFIDDLQGASAIGGHFELQRAERLEHGGRVLVYLVGLGMLDRSCCGTTGMRYAVVPGFLVDEAATWEPGTGANHEVEAVSGEGLRREISRAIRRREGLDQVVFW